MLLNVELIMALILVYVVLIVTELYVLKKEIKYIGMVIPVLSFALSIILCNNLALVMAINRKKYVIGYIISNIPTLILAILYIVKCNKGKVIK